ncbi:MAG: HAD-IIB family hydrolase, partial [Acholeplasmataceae bacterium]|nr:HAD-IIB family hydrolase [Acholeplasmataceae bacterium]
MKYLIACDLDGSLLNRKGELTNKTIKVIETLKDLGHVVVIATGRPFSGAISKYHELGLNTAMITDNGGAIDNPVDLTFAKQRTFIPLHMMHGLFTFSKPFIISTFFSVDNVVYAYKYDKRLEEFFSGIHSDRVIENDMTEFHVEPTGLIYLIDFDKQTEFEGFIDREYGHTLSYRLWDAAKEYAIYEVYLKHVSKSSALKYLLDHYEIDPKYHIAIGDGINDVEMIRDAAWGVAMSNCVPELR